MTAARVARSIRAVAETLVPEAGPELAQRVAAKLALLPRAADKAELERLLRLFESRIANFLLTGTPRPFSAMPVERRERYLRSWALSRLGLRRKGFQALKRLITMVHYTSAAARARIAYPGPLSPPPTTPPLKRLTPLAIDRDTTLDCEVVIVGSGAGGGVVAGELAAAGKDVIVLEKGGYYAEADFTHSDGEAQERLYEAAGLGATSDLAMLIQAGSCLGGGTVVNFTTSFHTPEAVRDEWAREHGLPHFAGPEFTASLDAVARRIGVNTAHATPSGRDRTLIRGLERLGWHHALLPRDVRGCPQDEACGYCGFGCRRGAKQSTLVTYLQDAAARGTRFVVGAAAERALIEHGRATGVEARVGAHRLVVRAHAVVVAGGSLHSPALLLRSGIRLPALGRFLALHPATAVFALMPEEIRPWTGTLQAHYSDQFADLDRGFGFKFETAPLHPSLAAPALPWESGRQHAEWMRRLSRTTLVAILLRDKDGGRVTVDRRGLPLVHYRLSPYDASHLRRSLAAGAELLEAAGAEEIWAPLHRWISYRPGQNARARWFEAIDAAGLGPNQLLLASYHQMASCRMGSSPGTSVVNAENQVWGVRGLYVADASVFPSASGVNPMLTIMGIAHRAAGIIAA